MSLGPTSQSTVIGILSAGEMGAALAALLIGDGFDVVTTLAGRSGRTRRLCEKLQINALESVNAVVAASDIVLSTVPPDQAVSTAEQVAEDSSGPNGRCTFVDANSVSPTTLTAVDEVLSGTPVTLVDASIHGMAHRLATHATCYLSGGSATEIASLLKSIPRVRVVSDRPGDASLMKMMIGGMSKGIIGLFLQSGLVATQAGFAARFQEELACFFPDVDAFVSRSFPSYPQHAARRAHEMRELQKTIDDMQISVQLARELARVFEQLNSSLTTDDSVAALSDSSVQQLLGKIAMSSALRNSTDREFLDVNEQTSSELLTAMRS